MSSKRFGIAICTLNQLCLDFDGNLQRILSSIDLALKSGASIRLGPELEITGYGCEDAFYEIDTQYHSWQIIGQILKKNYKNILICIGMPILKDSSLYNCIVVIYNSKIVYIRAKNRLAIHGNYRENRYFTPWNNGNTGSSLSWFELPPLITEINEQKKVPFGDNAILQIKSNFDSEDLQSSIGVVRIGFEICEELWRADSQSSSLFGVRGCHVVLNSSSSYWELRKLSTIFTHVHSITSKTGGVYAFSNNIGCDGGGRLCFYGRSMIMENGKLLYMSNDCREKIFEEISVQTIFIDPINVQNYRLQSNINIGNSNIKEKQLKFNYLKPYYYDDNENIDLDIFDTNTITMECLNFFSKNFHYQEVSIKYELNLTPEEEIMRYCSLWLWDYLRRCIPGGLKGFIIPLSGGLDSSSVACIVYCLCKLLFHQINVLKNKNIIESLKPILKDNGGVDSIKSPKDLCKLLLRCCYLKTKYSGMDSQIRAENLANLIGADFHIYDFTNLYENIIETVPLGIKPVAENDVTIQQQNVQARLRMVLTYYMSQCNRLVLATGNVDEALVGYLTKYDCSSADLNPIGSISKNDLKRFVIFCKEIIPDSEKILNHIINAIPSAELTGQEQKDEDDLGLTYDELSLFGKIRRGIYGTFGPYGMFCKIWNERHQDYIKNVFANDANTNLQPKFIADKVKRFFILHSRNRHKQTILTPSLHTETYSPDDNRFDHRQFLFNTKWPWQFAQIDRMVEKIQNESEQNQICQC